jgi:hypothetical protein
MTKKKPGKRGIILRKNTWYGGAYAAWDFRSPGQPSGWMFCGLNTFPPETLINLANPGVNDAQIAKPERGE